VIVGQFAWFRGIGCLAHLVPPFLKKPATACVNARCGVGGGTGMLGVPPAI
jgi:hypothetical protein